MAKKKQHGNVKWDEETVTAAIRGTGRWADEDGNPQTSAGIIQTVATRLGIARITVYEYLKRWPNLQTILAAEKETALDVAENTLFDMARKGNITALIFFLKTQGKARGYVERQEWTGRDGGEVTVNVVYGRERESGNS